MRGNESTNRRRKRTTEEEPTSTARLEAMTQPGSVFVEKGATVNLGDFNSYRLNLGMNLPINYTDTDLRAARKALRKCAAAIQEELDKILDADIPEE